MKAERDLVKWFTKKVESIGGVVVKFHGGRFSRAGVPDVHVDHPRWAGWIEFKSADGTLTPLQTSMIKRLRAAGASVFVLRIGDGVVLVEDGHGQFAHSVSAEGMLDALHALDEELWVQ